MTSTSTPPAASEPAASEPAASEPAAAAPTVTLRRLLPGVVAMSLVGSSVAVSHVLGDAPLFTSQGIRYAGAAALLYALAKLNRRPILRPTLRELPWLVGLALTGLIIFNAAVVRGSQHAEPAVIAVAVACVPVLLGIIGPMLEGGRPSRRVLLAAVVVTAGGVLVVGGGRTDALGILWALVALGCEAAFSLLAVPVLPRHTAWGVSLHSVWIGAVLLLVLGLVGEGPRAAGRLDAADWGAMAYLAVMVTAVAFICWYSTLARLGAARAGLLTGIAPIAAAITGIITGRRAPDAVVWLGMAVVVAGLATGLRAGSARRGGSRS